MHAAWLVVHAQCMPCVKIAPFGALSGTSAGHISVPSWPTRRCPPRALQLRQCTGKNKRVYAYMLCMCLQCYSSSLFLQLGGPTCVAPRRRRRDIWCEPKIHRLISNAQTRASKVTARSAAHWLLRTNGAAARSSAWPPLLAILQMPANRQKKTIPLGIYIEAVALK